MIQIINDQIIYKLGRNARENFELIDEATDTNIEYWWFHLEDHPSGHCIVYTDILDKTIIVRAASLVKSYSKLKGEKKVKVIYIQVKNIKKTKTLGEVILNEKPQFIRL